MSMVELEKPRPHVSLIKLNDPDTMNSMSFELVGELYKTLETVGADNDTSVAVMIGTGRGFCSGLNLEDVGAPPGIEGMTLARIAIHAMEYMSNLVPTLRAIPQPLIGAINGPAYGGGFCLSLGLDIRIAAESALFNAAGINNGLSAVELGSSYLLPRLIGASRSSEILLSGRVVDAQEADRIGLVSRTVPDDQLLEEALALAEQISAYSTHGVAMTKKVLWSSLECGSLEAAIDLENRNQLLVRMLTNNLDEAILARRENRKPVYKD